MERVKIEVELDSEIVELAKRVAEKEGITVEEFIRRETEKCARSLKLLQSKLTRA